MATQCRDINKLKPLAKQACLYLLDGCKQENLNIIVTETLRTVERQQELYAKGRTKPGTIVTNCDGIKKKSIHQTGMAFDVCHNVVGDEYNNAIIAKVGKIGMAIGLEWGGSWKGFVDSPHFQLNPNVTPKPYKKSTPVPKYNVRKIEIVVNGKIRSVHSILLHGLNHVKLRDLIDRDINIDYKNHKVYINSKVYLGKMINFEGNNFIKLRDLPSKDFIVSYTNGYPTVISVK